MPNNFEMCTCGHIRHAHAGVLGEMWCVAGNCTCAVFSLYQPPKESKVSEKFWMVFVPFTPRSAPTVRHSTLLDAELEATRLAGLPSITGKSVYVLEAVAKFEQKAPLPPPITRTTLY